MVFSTDASPDRPVLRRLTLLIRELLAQRPVRFILVGGVNTVFGFSVFTLFYLVSHMRQTSLVTATVVAVTFNYFTTGRLVFDNRGARRLGPFMLVYGICLVINMILLEVLARSGVPTLVAQAINLPIMVAISYVLNRYVVFAGAHRRP